MSKLSSFRCILCSALVFLLVFAPVLPLAWTARVIPSALIQSAPSTTDARISEPR